MHSKSDTWIAACVACIVALNTAHADDDVRRPFDIPRRSISVNASVGSDAPTSASLSYDRTSFFGAPQHRMGYSALTLTGAWELKTRTLADEGEAKHVISASGQLLWIPETTYDADAEALVLTNLAFLLHGQVGTPLGGGPSIRSMAGAGFAPFTARVSVPCTGLVHSSKCARALAEEQQRCGRKATSSDADTARCQRAKRRVERACGDEFAEDEDAAPCDHPQLALKDTRPNSIAFGAWGGFVDTHYEQPVFTVQCDAGLDYDPACVAADSPPIIIACDESVTALDCPAVNAFEPSYGIFLIAQYTWEGVLGKITFDGRILGLPIINAAPHSEVTMRAKYPLPFLPGIALAIAFTGMQSSHTDHLHATQQTRVDATLSYNYQLSE